MHSKTSNTIPMSWRTAVRLSLARRTAPDEAEACRRYPWDPRLACVLLVPGGPGGPSLPHPCHRCETALALNRRLIDNILPSAGAEELCELLQRKVMATDDVNPPTCPPAPLPASPVLSPRPSAPRPVDGSASAGPSPMRPDAYTFGQTALDPYFPPAISSPTSAMAEAARWRQGPLPQQAAVPARAPAIQVIETDEAEQLSAVGFLQVSTVVRVVR